LKFSGSTDLCDSADFFYQTYATIISKRWMQTKYQDNELVGSMEGDSSRFEGSTMEFDAIMGSAFTVLQDRDNYGSFGVKQYRKGKWTVNGFLS
jgi:hypothetical protein